MNTPKEIQCIFDSKPNVVKVTVAEGGFVPNSYKWPAPGTRTVYLRNGTVRKEKYDRKRSYGKGNVVVAWTAKGGHITCDG